MARYDKRELPNYGVFDEERTFSAGRRNLVFEVGGALADAQICEDIWLPDGPMNRSVSGGATVVLNISASPYHWGKGISREEMLRTRARDGLCFVAYCNLVGGQDELVFDGRSVVIDPDGDVLARAEAFAEDLLIVDVDSQHAVGCPAAGHAPAARTARTPPGARGARPPRLHGGAGAGRAPDLRARPAAGSTRSGGRCASGFATTSTRTASARW